MHVYICIVCTNNAVDCAVIPYYLKCIMRSSEMPITPLCLRKILVNIVTLRAHGRTRAETSARSVIVLKLLVIAVPT